MFYYSKLQKDMHYNAYLFDNVSDYSEIFSLLVVKLILLWKHSSVGVNKIQNISQNCPLGGYDNRKKILIKCRGSTCRIFVEYNYI